MDGSVPAVRVHSQAIHGQVFHKNSPDCVRITGIRKRPLKNLLQFNLSQPVASVIIGCEQLTPLEQNVQAAMNFTPMGENAKQKLQEQVAPSRSAWEDFLRTHEDMATA